MVLNAAPKLPTMPVCSQWEMVLLRTRWWPMFFLVQGMAKAWARPMVLT